MKASKEFVTRYYTDDLAEYEREESKWARQWAKEVKGEKVLDIACGPQLYDDALLFDGKLREIVGLDINETNIDFLMNSDHSRILESKKILIDRGVDVKLLVQDIKNERKDFIDQFDSIFASGILGNFDQKDTRKILDLIHKYLKSRGRLVIVGWADARLSKEKTEEREKFGWYQKDGVTAKEVGDLLEEGGFKIIKREIYNVPNPDEYEWGIIYGYVAEK